MAPLIKVLGIITARSGSKSIPHKNVKELCGKPLIAYTIESAQGSKLLGRTIVSTDSQEYADIAKQYGAEVPFLRPKEISGDQSTSIEVVQHALNWLKSNENEEYDYVMILQPTSPFRTADDIDACIRLASETNADSVMSMVELTDFSPKKLKKIEDGVIKPLFEKEGKMSEPRSVSEKIYKRNAAVYLTKTSHIMQGDLFGSVSRAYIMPRERSIDINEPIDFTFAEFLMKRNGEK